MGEQTKIEWADHTFNIAEGCQKISPACENCYAERRDKQYHGGTHWGPNTRRKMMSESYWKQPLKWNAQAQAESKRYRVFSSSLADVFEDHPDLIEPRERLFDLIKMTPHLDWLLLTKRPENIRKMFLPDYQWRDNIWLGTTVENQKYADSRIPELIKIPAKIRFLSIEPMLGPIDLLKSLAQCRQTIAGQRVNEWIHWVIAGGESGPNARPSHPGWLCSLRDQCQAAGIAFHFKQWGEWKPSSAGSEYLGLDGKWQSKTHWHNNQSTSAMKRIGKAAAGRQLDGQEWNEVPR